MVVREQALTPAGPHSGKTSPERTTDAGAVAADDGRRLLLGGVLRCGSRYPSAAREDRVRIVRKPPGRSRPHSRPSAGGTRGNRRARLEAPQRSGAPVRGSAPAHPNGPGRRYRCRGVRRGPRPGERARPSRGVRRRPVTGGCKSGFPNDARAEQQCQGDQRDWQQPSHSGPHRHHPTIWCGRPGVAADVMTPCIAPIPDRSIPRLASLMPCRLLSPYSTLIPASCLTGGDAFVRAAR